MKLPIHMRLATVDGHELSLALREMSQAPRTLLGSAFWCFDEELTIHWTSYRQAVDARIEASLVGPVRVSGETMKQLGVIVALEGETHVVWDDERQRLRVGVHSLRAEMVDSAPGFTLALDAGEGELLKELLGRGRRQVDEAGYHQEAEAVVQRWEESLRAAWEVLAWTGVSRDAVRAHLEEALRCNE